MAASIPAAQVKLLTLLNVSAVKRPFELDRPGGSRRRQEAVALAAEEHAQHQLQDAQEPATKKKKKGISWGGEMGPTGSTVVKKSSVTKAAEPVNVKSKSKGKPAGKASAPEAVVEEKENVASAGPLQLEADDGSDDDDETTSATTKKDTDAFNLHFDVSPAVLTSEAIQQAESGSWKQARKTVPGLGKVVEYDVGEGSSERARSRVTPQLLQSFQAKHPKPSAALAATTDALSKYRDLMVTNLDGDADGTSKHGGFGPETEAVRSAAAMHALNHVLKTRKRVIRNNERLAKGGGDVDARDQSFVRPKVLLLLPTRNLALHFLEQHVFPLAPPGTQIENRRPLTSSFSLPDGVEDPLDPSNPDVKKTYPPDHVATFRGNSDDNFRFGLKLTRKAWRVVLPPASEEKLVACDILIASPLGIRMAADKEGGCDVLSSIEVCIADGLDVMSMQNWEHVQHVFDNLNKIPNSPHGCDFSRVKPWYLESQARFLRQTLLISRYETPEIRALFNRSLVNVEGKIRLDRSECKGVLDRVKPGVKQVFERIPGNDPLEELDARFDYFCKTTLPALRKSAVSREKTLIMVPSYFDYIRVVNHFRKIEEDEGLSFAAISEYSSNAEISAARTAFFKGKKAFLIVTERFHFYRRYKLRGARTLVFYALPDHAIFYPELLAGPFLPNASGKQTQHVDPEDVTCRVAFSKWDVMRLARVVGTNNARKMVTGVESKFTFV